MASEVDTFLEETSNSSTSDASSLAIVSADGRIVKTLNEQDLRTNAAELIDYMMDHQREMPKFYNANNLLKSIVEVKKAFFPAMAKSLTIDATNVFEQQLEKWKKARLEVVKDSNVVEYEIQNAENEIEEEGIKC